MAHIVDDKDNIKHFLEIMSGFASRFANGRYEPSRMTTLHGPATSIIEAPSTEPTNVDALPRTMTFQHSHVPPEEHKDLKLSSTKETDSADLFKAKHRMQNEGPPVDHQLSTSDFFGAANKQLQSPQLSGLRAPPPTPETLARNGHTNSDNVGALVGPEVGKILAGNGRPVGLEGSRYASYQPFPLNKQQAQVEVSGKFNAAQVQSIKTSTDLPHSGWQADPATREVVDPWHTPNSELLDSFDEPKLGHKTAPAFKDEPLAQPEVQAVSMPFQREITSSTANKKTTAANLNSRLFVEEMQAQIMAFQASRRYKPSAAMGQPGKTSLDVTVAPSPQSLTSRPHVPPALSYSQAELLALRPKNPNMGIVKGIPIDLRVAAEKSTVGGRPTSRDEGKLIDFDNGISPPHLRFPAGLKNEIPSSYKRAEIEAPKKSTEAGLSTTVLLPQSASAPLALKSVAEKEGLPLQNPNVNPRPTPSSQASGFVAPSTVKDRLGAGVKISTSAAAASGQSEDLFLGKNWRKPEKRDSAAASQVRKVIITKLPENTSPRFIASLVYGGPLENINVTSNMASVRFLEHKDCMKFYEATSNGLVYGMKGNEELFVFVELAKDVDVIGGLLRSYIDQGYTRCVRVIGADDHWTIDNLWKIATSKNRKVEHIKAEKNTGGYRTITFRFCDISDAFNFKATIVRDEDWEHCNIKFVDDPCAAATGIHFD